MKPVKAQQRGKAQVWRGILRLGLAIVMLTSVLASGVEAQQIPRSWEVKAVVGVAGYLDEDTDYAFVIGGAVRTYVSPRVAIEPEFLYVRQTARLEDFIFRANVVRDFAGNDKARPYLISGIGLRHRRSKHPGARRPRSTHNGFTGGGGVGVRLQLSDRLFMSPEFRIGWQPLFRATVALGGTGHKGVNN
jgi:hypothetical protein